MLNVIYMYYLCFKFMEEFNEGKNNDNGLKRHI